MPSLVDEKEEKKELKEEEKKPEVSLILLTPSRKLSQEEFVTLSSVTRLCTLKSFDQLYPLSDYKKGTCIVVDLKSADQRKWLQEQVSIIHKDDTKYRMIMLARKGESRDECRIDFYQPHSFRKTIPSLQLNDTFETFFERFLEDELPRLATCCWNKLSMCTKKVLDA